MYEQCYGTFRKIVGDNWKVRTAESAGVEKRLDQLEKRMDRIDVRFEQSTRQITVWLGLITVLIALIGSMGAWGMFAG